MNLLALFASLLAPVLHAPPTTTTKPAVHRSAPRECPAALVSAAEAHGVDATWVCRVAWCESRWMLDPPGNRSHFGPTQVSHIWRDRLASAGINLDDVRRSWDTALAATRFVLDHQGKEAWTCR